jgi:hypothetical protein
MESFKEGKNKITKDPNIRNEFKFSETEIKINNKNFYFEISLALSENNKDEIIVIIIREIMTHIQFSCKIKYKDIFKTNFPNTFEQITLKANNKVHLYKTNMNFIFLILKKYFSNNSKDMTNINSDSYFYKFTDINEESNLLDKEDPEILEKMNVIFTVGNIFSCDMILLNLCYKNGSNLHKFRFNFMKIK